MICHIFKLSLTFRSLAMCQLKDVLEGSHMKVEGLAWRNMVDEQVLREKGKMRPRWENQLSSNT